MSKSYSQWRAMLAVTKGSMRAILRSPSAIIFGIGFPLIFIVVFGLLGSTSPVLKIAFAPDSDTANAMYRMLQSDRNIKVVEKPYEALQNELTKGRITAILRIVKMPEGVMPKYRLDLQSSTASVDRISMLQSALREMIAVLDAAAATQQNHFAEIKQLPMIQGRIYRSIDFILPGQLGFSLLSSGVFGVAFLFFNLRNQLILKRFFATPIRRAYIVFGEGISRVAFGMLTAVVILLAGHFIFKFTLVNGMLTFLELLLLSVIGLIVFMGFGFVVSGLAKNESTIPPFANLVTLPQFLLSGTFFSIENFPTWLQPLCNALPLTHLNNAMRNIAFEGAHLYQCGTELAVLLAWGIGIYALAVRVFRWE